MIDFETIYKENFKVVYGYIFSMCNNAHIAEEITQETFFKALKSIDKFEKRSKISVWLCEIAKNTYFTYCNKSKRFVSTEEKEEKTIANDIFLDTFIDSEDVYLIHKILHDIEEPYKEVFTLRVFGELPYKNIGDLFKKTESWARVTFYRAKQKIVNKMEGNLNE